MIIGCPKEIKTREYRVGLVPGGAAALTGRGHQVLIEKGAGLGSGIPDAAYEAAGAKIVYGTDAGVFPHRQNNKDFALLQTMGMQALDLLRAATSRAADMIGTKDRGRLAPGLLADVVAFGGDPGANAALLEKPPALIMVGGKRIDRTALSA